MYRWGFLDQDEDLSPSDADSESFIGSILISASVRRALFGSDLQILRFPQKWKACRSKKRNTVEVHFRFWSADQSQGCLFGHLFSDTDAVLKSLVFVGNGLHAEGFREGTEIELDHSFGLHVSYLQSTTAGVRQLSGMSE